ncbi:MAG: hypothetical protein HY791_15550 [Deltaproteobacteria bacterium]|nr:hypothetical protein [Deltaproteobacteria bacterium]
MRPSRQLQPKLEPDRTRARDAGPIGAIESECRTLREQRAYRTEDLVAIASVGWHYLQNGALELAETLFAGLYAVDPSEPYHALALGAVFDKMGQKDRADVFYARASKLDPTDPRPLVNRAELAIETGNFPVALELLEEGYRRAKLRRDEALEQKAVALLHHLERGLPPCVGPSRTKKPSTGGE